MGMPGIDELPRERAADAVAPPGGSDVEAAHAKRATDVGALRDGADPDDSDVGDRGQDRLPSAEESFALVFPSLTDGGDDPDALAIRVFGEQRDRVGQERSGRHDLEQLAHRDGR